MRLIKKGKVPVAHRLGRPSGTYQDDLLCLCEDGTWVIDDGAPGLAFSGQILPYRPGAWVSYCGCRSDDLRCPQNRAIEKTLLRYRCANIQPMVT